MQDPEAQARSIIDQLLQSAGWNIQDRSALNLGAARGVAEQSDSYAVSLPPNVPHVQLPLPFLFESTGTETLFRDEHAAALGAFLETPDRES
jgi:type I restriction enzyme, R subunit